MRIAGNGRFFYASVYTRQKPRKESEFFGKLRFDTAKYIKANFNRFSYLIDEKMSTDGFKSVDRLEYLDDYFFGDSTWGSFEYLIIIV